MDRKLAKLFFVALMISLTIFVVPSSKFASSPKTGAESTKPLTFQDAMRKLWEDHIIWTRVFIISAAADLPDKSVTTERLLQNQVDIGNAIKPYYGDEAGNKLTTLLKEHITTAAESWLRLREVISLNKIMQPSAGSRTRIKSQLS
jgi:hypothetical protein